MKILASVLKPEYFIPQDKLVDTDTQLSNT